MILRTLPVGALGTNCYLVTDETTREALVIDPGGDELVILRAVQQAKAQVRLIVLTHFHFDHILAAGPLREATGASLAIHADEAAWLKDPPALFRLFAPDVPRGLVADRLLQAGEVLTAGALQAQVLATPGHSPGGITLWLPTEQVVFCGDALFREGIGRTDFPGSSYAQLIESIRTQLLSLPDETVVYPGHGPSTTIGHERRHNPWLNA